MKFRVLRYFLTVAREGSITGAADLSKYNYINIPAKDVWGVVMRKDSPLAFKREQGDGSCVSK